MLMKAVMRNQMFPKRKERLKKLRKHPKHVKQSEEKESKVASKKREPTSSKDYAKELKVDDIDTGAIRTVTGGGTCKR